ncbi:MAG: acetyl-CoA carboxylase carboxyltransferase subunit alpha [Gammaproteobacteria bacterium]
MNSSYLEFEQPIADLEAKIDELRLLSKDSDIDINDELGRLQKRSHELTKSIFSSLTPWQISLLARHLKRPYTLEYIERIFSDFDELHGDRSYSDDAAVVCGIARLEGQPVALIGHQKGRNTHENLKRNFGMPRPEGYRKALRIIRLAEKFQLPVLTFIDTPGAYPGIGAEERGQSEAIAKNLFVMARLRTPIIATVIGEGGSGGALAIGVADRLLMLQYATYSVISPEGCASILWKSAEKAQAAADAMGITADRLLALGLIDEIVSEPLGGAHRDVDAMSSTLKQTLLRILSELRQFEMESLLAARYHRLMDFGRYSEAH